MSTENSPFVGTWEITESYLDGTSEKLGLDGIKFRLDEMGDIIWYNDLIHTNKEEKLSNFEQVFCPINDSAHVLFSCETFEFLDLTSNGPGLVFGAYTGHSIEFKVNTYNPVESMSLKCDGWCQLVCKRVMEDQSIGQEIPFSLISVLDDGNFCDVTLKSCDNVIYNIHSPILRLNGFDCSIMATASYHCSPVKSDGQEKAHKPLTRVPSVPSNQKHRSKIISSSNSTTNFLLPPSLDPYNLSPKFVNTISNSYNCLPLQKDLFLDVPKKNHQSSSDSNLHNHSERNVFLFPAASFMIPNELRTKYKSPPSPFRTRSPSPFPCNSDSPSSPLTPLSVLNNLPSKMLSAILYWLYCECLPTDLDEETCFKLISMSECTPPLNRMTEPCKNYLRNIKLKKFVINIIADLHTSLNRIIQMINPSTIAHDPCSLCQAFKECVKEVGTDIVKMLQFCNIFTKDVSQFNRTQRHEIIKYVRGRLPIFLSQIHQILQNINSVLCSLLNDEKNDLTTYLVPETICALELITSVISEIKCSLEKVCKDLRSSNHRSEHSGRTPPLPPNRDRPRSRTRSSGYCDNLCHSSTTSTATESKLNQNRESDLKFFLYMYEVKKMRDIYGRVTSALEVIEHKKATFNEMNHIHQHHTVARNVEQLILEIPVYISRLEELCDTIDEKIGWKEFKFCFKFLTSQVNGIISKLLEHKSALNDAMTHLTNLMQKDQFTRAMMELGLLQSKPGEETDGFGTESSVNYTEYNNSKINLVQSLCEPPCAINSSLSKNALKLLHSGHLADMEFEIIVTPTDRQNENIQFDFNIENGKSQIFDNICLTTPDVPSKMDRKKVSTPGGKISNTFKAHRVIVAARCEWFKKALLSGMQEDINRRIIIHDTSPVIFRRLLLYLYGAPVDKSVGVEQLCELMLLADRYSVDNLKNICESTLVNSIDSDSVICLLGIADRFNASALKMSCLSYMSQHNELTHLDIFHELPINLQSEVQDLIKWCGRVHEPWSEKDKSPRERSRHSLKSPSRSKSRSRKTSPSFM